MVDFRIIINGSLVGGLTEVRKLTHGSDQNENQGSLTPKALTFSVRFQPCLEAVAAGKEERSVVFLTAISGLFLTSSIEWFLSDFDRDKQALGKGYFCEQFPGDVKSAHQRHTQEPVAAKKWMCSHRDAECDGWPASGTMMRVSDGHVQKTQTRQLQCCPRRKPPAEQDSEPKHAGRCGRSWAIIAHGPVLSWLFPSGHQPTPMLSNAFVFLKIKISKNLEQVGLALNICFLILLFISPSDTSQRLSTFSLALRLALLPYPQKACILCISLCLNFHPACPVILLSNSKKIVLKLPSKSVPKFFYE